MMVVASWLHVLLCLVAGAIAGCGVGEILERWLVVDRDSLLVGVSILGTAALGCVLGIVTRKEPLYSIGFGALYLIVSLTLAGVINSRRPQTYLWWPGRGIGYDFAIRVCFVAATVGFLHLLLGLLAHFLTRSRPACRESTP